MNEPGSTACALAPHFGQVIRGATVHAVTGALVRVLKARLENGDVVTVPRANVELL